MIDTAARPPRPPRQSPGAERSGDDADHGLIRSTRVMAAGTLASRFTGLLSKLLLAWAIGVAVGDAYNVANTIPNIVYELLLGGILTSVVVPLIVAAAARGADDGEAYAQRLLTLVALTLGIASVLAVVAAPWIVRLYIGHFSKGAPDEHLISVATTFARFFLPQILFYGIGATMGAILNTRGRFAAPMWAPVLNNLILIATFLVFFAVPGPGDDLVPATITTAQVLTLGIGTTLGIVAQTVALVPALRAAGFRWRPRFDFRRTGLGEAGRLAGWVLLYVLVNQIGYLVITNLATSAFASGDGSGAGGYSIYVWAFMVFQLPHAVVAVSVITALLPRMSRHAVDARLDLVTTELSRGLRLAAVVLVPATFAYLALNQPIMRLLFGHFRITADDTTIMGWTLAAFALGMLPFSGFQLQLRAFYALRDTRTPALVNIAVNAVNLVVAGALFVALPARWIVPGLAVGYAVSYAAGLALFSRLLHRRLGSVDGHRVVRTLVRLTIAGLGGGALAYLVASALMSALGTGSAGSAAALCAAVPLGGAFYLWVAGRLRVSEIRALMDMVRSRVTGSSRRARRPT
ncbi:MAG: murein biosynthesis integral membrane protein MurJ [Frankiaceae bacterium]